MGGPGSGNVWNRPGKRSTVEDSLVVSVWDFQKRLYAGAAGAITWTWTSGGSSTIGYFVTETDDDDLAVTLYYRWRGTEDVIEPVRMQTTPTQFGGSRWWFTCPLVVGGNACNRRAGKLYLSPGSRYFGCRQCHKLTYRSCQESHQMERACRRLGYSPEEAREFAKRPGSFR